MARLVAALERGEKIATYGDYDVDGVTSTVAALRLPARRRRRRGHLHPAPAGRGVRPQRRGGRRSWRPQGVKLLVSLDCGITSVEEVRAAADARRGDGGGRPPHRAGRAARRRRHPQPAPARLRLPVEGALGGGGHLHAADGAAPDAARGRPLRAARPEPNLRAMLDLVALGTVADVVPLTGANRILVRHGLAEIATTRRPGLRALKRVAGVPEGRRSPPGRSASGSAPRINAAGRLDDAGRGVRLLSTLDEAEASALADELDRENQARQEIERRMLAEALDDAAAAVRRGARRAGAGPRGLARRRGRHRGGAGGGAVPPAGGAGRPRRRGGEGERPLHRGLPPLRRPGGLQRPPAPLRRPPPRRRRHHGRHRPRAVPGRLRGPRRRRPSRRRTWSRAAASTAGWRRASSPSGPPRTSRSSAPSAPATPSRSSRCARGRPGRAPSGPGRSTSSSPSARGWTPSASPGRARRPLPGAGRGGLHARLRRLGRDPAAAAQAQGPARGVESPGPSPAGATMRPCVARRRPLPRRPAPHGLCLVGHVPEEGGRAEGRAGEGQGHRPAARGRAGRGPRPAGEGQGRRGQPGGPPGRAQGLGRQERRAPGPGRRALQVEEEAGAGQGRAGEEERRVPGRWPPRSRATSRPAGSSSPS